MKRTLTQLKRVGPHLILVRDDASGIARVEDYSAGIAHSCHPNVSKTGNARKVYGKKARLKRAWSFIYNTSDCVVSSKLDELARKHCRCGGNHDTAR